MVLLPMIVITILIMQFAVLLFVVNDMQNAARDAARQLAVSDTATYTAGTTDCRGALVPGSVEDRACADLAWWGTAVHFSVATTVTEIASGNCEQIRVEVSSPFGDATIFDIFNVLSGRTLRLSTEMRSQYDILEGGAPSTLPGCV